MPIYASGAALVDSDGNILATGTNEAPKAVGGVYGESVDSSSPDYRCTMFPESEDRFCRNTQTQNKIINKLISN